MARITRNDNDHGEPPVVRPVRAGWAETFAAMAASGDDRLLDQPVPTQFDRAEWTW